MRTDRRCMLALVVALVSACRSAPPNHDAGPTLRHYQGAGFEGIVVAPWSQMPPGSFHFNEEALWTPDDGSIARFEAGLAAHLRASPPPESPGLHAKYGPYYRRYIGLEVRGARKLYVSFYCPILEQWQHLQAHPFTEICDGGDCFFNVLYDVTTGAYEQVDVNGEA